MHTRKYVVTVKKKNAVKNCFHARANAPVCGKTQMPRAGKGKHTPHENTTFVYYIDIRHAALFIMPPIVGFVHSREREEMHHATLKTPDGMIFIDMAICALL